MNELEKNLEQYRTAKIIAESDFSQIDPSDFDEVGVDPDENYYGNIMGVSVPVDAPPGGISRDIGRGLAKGALSAGDNLNKTLPLLGLPVDLINEYVLKPIGLDTENPVLGSKMIEDGVNYILELGQDLVPKKANVATQKFVAEEPSNKLIQGIFDVVTEFGLNAVTPALYLRAFTVMTPIARGLAWGGISDFINSQPNEQTAIAQLTNLLSSADENTRSAISDAVLKVFEKQESDPEVVSKARAALEGMVLGGAIEKGAEQLVKVYKYIKGGKARQDIVKAGQAADERIAQRDPRATLTSGFDPTQPTDAVLSAAGRIARDEDDAIDIATTEATNQATGLTEFIKNNPDGFTIDLNGFETVPIGFAVAPLKRTEIILDSADLTAENVYDLIKNVKTLTNLSGQKAYAGGWLNSNDGKYYLDASFVFDNEPDALYTAAAGRQISVYNLGTFDEINTVEGFKKLRKSRAFDVGRFNERRAASAELDQRAEQAGVQDPVSRERARASQDPLDMAPPGARAHKVPHQLLIKGTGEKPQYKVTQAFTAANKTANFSAIDQAKSAHPDALSSKENWVRFQQSTFGGDLLPVPPMQAIRYAQSAENMAAKLRQLTPEMKAGVDEGFKNVSVLRDLYASGQAQPKMTADLFLWGILSRGAGPVQQESAYIDIIQDATPLIQKAVNGTFSDADLKTWVTQISKSLPEGSPGKQVTMNVNAAGKLLMELSKTPEGSDKNVLGILHDMLSDQTKSATEIRREFMALTDRAGIDNKVVSFILLVGGRDDVLVMDRIQARHLYDDGRFEGNNIYDGFLKAGTTAREGLQGFMRGPRGLLVTEALEDGLRKNVQEAYRAIGREGDASLGRFHWETWVIDGEQVVDHETLKAVASGSPVGVGVREGKAGTFSSGMKYMRTDSGTVVEYPLSDGSNVYFTPTQMKEFEKFVKNPNNDIVPRGFKVTERTDVRWYERPEVDRDKLDAEARKRGKKTIE